jgi:phospholipid/cholesterol/gamma-HCH transport system substrate-binding protein
MVMAPRRNLELLVGFFMLLGIAALLMLALQVSGLTQNIGHRNSYTLSAQFDNIGGLKVRAPVAIAGVRIGEVTNITLDPVTFRAVVNMNIDKKNNDLPIDTSASILTAGLLGANYISLTPGYQDALLKNGDMIQKTSPALILEDLIGQLLFSLKGDDKDKDSKHEE